MTSRGYIPYKLRKLKDFHQGSLFVCLDMFDSWHQLEFHWFCQLSFYLYNVPFKTDFITGGMIPYSCLEPLLVLLVLFFFGCGSIELSRFKFAHRVAMNFIQECYRVTIMLTLMATYMWLSHCVGKKRVLSHQRFGCNSTVLRCWVWWKTHHHSSKRPNYVFAILISYWF